MTFGLPCCRHHCNRDGGCSNLVATWGLLLGGLHPACVRSVFRGSLHRTASFRGLGGRAMVLCTLSTACVTLSAEGQPREPPIPRACSGYGDLKCNHQLIIIYAPRSQRSASKRAPGAVCTPTAQYSHVSAPDHMPASWLPRGCLCSATAGLLQIPRSSCSSSC